MVLVARSMGVADARIRDMEGGSRKCGGWRKSDTRNWNHEDGTERHDAHWTHMPQALRVSECQLKCWYIVAF